jgi:hypothetical protein
MDRLAHCHLFNLPAVLYRRIEGKLDRSTCGESIMSQKPNPSPNPKPKPGKL